jgi:twitching motility protein PilT
MFDLHEALRYVVRKEGSDLHLKVSSRPLVRVHGRLGPIEESEPLSGADTERVLREMLTDVEKVAEFEEEGEVDFAYSVEGLARFRVNAFRQRGAISIALRVIPYSVRTIAELGLPAVVSDLADEERGLILLTGTTGSGKSTTLAAIVDQINETKARHIDQPARGRDGHRLVRPRDASRTAPGPRCDSDRRDARRGDRPHGARRS